MVFVDTNYYVALIHKHDQWRQRALQVTTQLSHFHPVTTQEVLAEFLGFMGKLGPSYRREAGYLVEQLLGDSTVQVVAQSDESFRAGLALYRQRPDKEYSLVDCISMVTMRKNGITHILTHDHHFTQEGFTALLRG